jgi:protein arginine kinase activator
MQCEVCHLHDATRAVTRTVDGEPRELYVCDECARLEASPPAPEAPGAPDSHSVSDVLFSLGMPVPPSGRAADAVCPVCGLSRGDLRAHRRLGCPRCFDTFGTDVRTFLSSRVPAAPRSREDPDEAMRARDAARIRGQLDDAVREERYEEAARLVARLHALRRPAPRKPREDG